MRVCLRAGACLPPLSECLGLSLRAQGVCLGWGQVAQNLTELGGHPAPSWPRPGCWQGPADAARGSDILSGSRRGAGPVGLRAAVGSLGLLARAAEEGAAQHGQAGGGPAQKQGWTKFVPARGGGRHQVCLRLRPAPSSPGGSQPPPWQSRGRAGRGELRLGPHKRPRTRPVSWGERSSFLPPLPQHINTTRCDPAQAGLLRAASSPFPPPAR